MRVGPAPTTVRARDFPDHRRPRRLRERVREGRVAGGEQALEDRYVQVQGQNGDPAGGVFPEPANVRPRIRRRDDGLDLRPQPRLHVVEHFDRIARRQRSLQDGNPVGLTDFDDVPAARYLEDAGRQLLGRSPGGAERRVGDRFPVDDRRLAEVSGYREVVWRDAGVHVHPRDFDRTVWLAAG